MTKEIIRAIVILGIVYILSGCSTISGLGRDITAGADATKMSLKDYVK